MDKVMSIPTAKEMWEAIQVLHRGSKDDQNALQFELNREFHSFSMKDRESVGSYHSRFQTLCDKMKASGSAISHTSRAGWEVCNGGARHMWIQDKG